MLSLFSVDNKELFFLVSQTFDAVVSNFQFKLLGISEGKFIRLCRKQSSLMALIDGWLVLDKTLICFFFCQKFNYIFKHKVCCEISLL